MKTLVIDSHKGSSNAPSGNMHWQNAKLIADSLNADLIWSYPTVNDDIKSDYDVIIFNHASHYAYTDYLWLERSPNAKLFYIANEYNLGEPRTLWMAVKRAGRDYQVIANHPPEPSKIVKKYTSAWHNVNLNALVFNAVESANGEKNGCVYYGSFRKNRIESFQKYLKGKIIVSTHVKNREKFKAIGVEGPFINRIGWAKDGLATYKTLLYIEDEVTHEYYNHLANRFYEGLSYNVIPLFDEGCKNTLLKSGYDFSSDFIVTSHDEAIEITNHISGFHYINLERWKLKALQEKETALETIKKIVYS